MRVDLHGQPQRRAPQERKQRRDAGVAKKEEDMEQIRAKSGAPVSEAAFARKRATVIEEAVRATPQARSETRRKHVLVAVATAVAAETVAASAKVQEKTRKRATEARTSYREAEAQAKKARAKLESKTARAFVGAPGGG